VRALHRIVVAALFVFGVMGGAGAATLRTFFVLAGLAPWIACSESTLRSASTAMIDAIGTWGDATGEQLGNAVRGGPERLISIALDETWKRTMILVAMDTKAASQELLPMLAGRRATNNRRSGNWSGSVPARVPRWFAYPPNATGLAALLKRA
jgi:hypothetical protein